MTLYVSFYVCMIQYRLYSRLSTCVTVNLLLSSTSIGAEYPRANNENSRNTRIFTRLVYTILLCVCKFTTFEQTAI